MNSKNIFFFAIISFLFLSAGQLLFGRQGLLIGFFLASIFNLYFYFYNHKRTLHALKCKKIVGQDIWNLQEIASSISKNLNAPKPSLFISSLDEPFAFTFSKGWGDTHIVITESLLNDLSEIEIKDLLTLQIFYSISSPSLFAGSRMILCEILFIFAQTLDFIINVPLLFFKQQQPILFFQKLLSPLTILIQKSFHKKLLHVDTEASKIIGSKERLSKLLWKLNSLSHSQPITTAPSCMLVYAVNPLTSSGSSSYFQIHANIEIRIQNLTGYPSV